MLPVFLSGCTHENPDWPDPDEGLVPKFVIERTEIEVPADSCRLEFSYIIENPVEGAVVEAFSDDDWIVDADASVEGKISVGLTANDSQDVREGTVQVTYSALEEGFSIKIRQMGANTSTDGQTPFEISVIDTEPTAVAYSVTPEDKEMGYITMVISREAFDRYASDEEYFLNELEYYRMLASAYGVLFEEYLAGILKHGTLSYQYFNSLEPETGQGIFVVCSCRGFVYGHGHFRAEQRAYSPGIFRGGYSHQYVQKRFSAGAFLREVCPCLLIFKNVS